MTIVIVSCETGTKFWENKAIIHDGIGPSGTGKG